MQNISKFAQISLILFGLTLSFQMFGQQKANCLRTAKVLQQDVLVDTNSCKKGEGLRNYLEKDPAAKEYLEQYQSNSELKWQNALVGTLGTSLLIAGIGKSGNILEGHTLTTQRALIIGGISLILLNVLIVKTFQFNNEKLLLHSVEEYNKRGLPKIYFGPFHLPGKEQSQSNFGVTTGFVEEF